MMQTQTIQIIPAPAPTVAAIEHSKEGALVTLGCGHQLFLSAPEYPVKEDPWTGGCLRCEAAQPVPTCVSEGCTYTGRELFPYDCGLLCGRCADKAEDDADNDAMPYLTSEPAWLILKAMDAA